MGRPHGILPSMTAKEVLQEVATMNESDWIEIQSGIAEMLASRLSESQLAEIQNALDEAEAELQRVLHLIALLNRLLFLHELSFKPRCRIWEFGDRKEVCQSVARCL